MFRAWLIIGISTIAFSYLDAQDNVTASVNTFSRTASMTNGIISITINSKGQVDALIYNNGDLIDALHGGRFYFSNNDQDSYQELSHGSIRIEKQTGNYGKVVYTNSSGTLIVEQAYILVKGVSGIYG